VIIRRNDSSSSFRISDRRPRRRACLIEGATDIRGVRPRRRFAARRTPEENLWQVLILLGANDTQPTAWNGNLSIDNGDIHALEAYRFDPPAALLSIKFIGLERYLRSAVDCETDEIPGAVAPTTLRQGIVQAGSVLFYSLLGSCSRYPTSLYSL
jgi:hypothetical protein